MRSPRTPLHPDASHALKVLRQLKTRFPPGAGSDSSISALFNDLAGSIEKLGQERVGDDHPDSASDGPIKPARRVSLQETEKPAAGRLRADSLALQRAQAALQESEERIRLILENSQDAPYRRNLQTDRYDYLSPTLQDHLGWSPEEMMSADIQTVLDHVHPEDLAGVEAEITRTDQECRRMGRSTGRLVYRFRGQDGRYRWVSDQITVLAGPDGRPLYRQGFLRDITDQKEIEDALHQHQAMLQAIMETIPDPIFLKDRESRVQLANPATFLTIGKTPEETLGKTDLEIYDDPRIGQAMIDNDRRVLETGSTQVIEEKVAVAGNERIFLSTKTPYRDAAGSIQGIIGIARDITQTKENEEKLRQLNRTLRALSAINLALLRAKNEAELMQAACKIMVEDCGHKMVWIGFKQDDESKTVVPMACAGFDDGYLETLRVTWADTERGRGPTGIAIRSGKPAFCRNMLTDPAFEPWRKEAIRRGYSASVALPMRIDQEVIGMFCIYSTLPDPFSADEVNLLTELVDNLCYGIHVLRIRAAHAAANKALRASEERYRSLFESMNEGFALHEVLCDANGRPYDYRFLDINPSFEVLTGLKRQDVIGQLKSVVLPDGDPFWVDTYGKVALTGKPVQFDHFATGLNRHYEVYAYRPAPMQFAVLFLDITERKHAEDQIVALARFPQENPYPVMRVDASGVLLFGNASSLNIQKTWGCQSGDFIPPEWRERVSRVLMNLQPETTRLNSGDILYEVWLVPIAVANYVNVYCRDITEQEAAAEALRQTLVGLEQRVAERTQELLAANRDLRDEAEERRRVENSLREANAYNRGLLEASLDALVTITPDGKVNDVNLATELVTGCSRQELIGTDFADYFTDPIRARAGYRQVFETGKVRDYELEICHKNGSLTQVLYNATVLLDESGEPASVFAVARDITASKRAQELINLQASALEATANGMVITDIQGRLQWANRAFTEMTGYSAAEISGQNMRFLRSGAQPLQFYRELWDTILSGNVWQGDLTNRRKDGRLYIEEQTITPVKNEAGAITHFIAVKQDITQRKDAERALQQQEALLNTVLENLPVGVWLGDQAGNIYRSNPAAEKVWEGTAYVGPKEYSVFRGWHADTGEEIHEWAAARAVRTGERTVNEQVEIECFDGSHKFMLNSVIPLLDEKKKVNGIVCVNQDITPIRKAQEELEKALANEQALRDHLVQVEKYTAIGRMVASITHELNNPLQSIKNCLYLTRQELPEDTPHPYLDMATAEVQRLSVLVSQLREVYRPRSAGQKEPVNLTDLIAQVRVLVNHQLEASNVTWEKHPASQRFVAFGIPDQLKQVFLNICLNAIEAMQPNGGTLHIELLAEPENRRHGILFRDTGKGISPENQAKLFEPLFTTKPSGMGLGLSISMDIIHKHGGQITVESHPGSGTTFTVWLPIYMELPDSNPGEG